MIKVLNKNLSDKLNILVLSILYGSSWLLVISNNIFSNSIMRYTIIFMSIFYFLILYLKLNLSKNSKLKISFKVCNWSMIICWVLFSFAIIISELNNLSFPSKGFFYLIIVLLFFIIIIPSTLKNPVKDIIISSFFSSFIYLVISIIYEMPRITSTYYGIFANPNSLGQVAIVSTVSSLFLLKEMYEKKRKVYTILYFLFSMISLFMLMISKSRTALLALIIVFFISALIILIGKRGHIVIKKGFGLRFVIILTLFLLIYFNFLHDILIDGVVNKFHYQLGKGDIFSSRQLTWKTVIEEISLFGYGEDYFSSGFYFSAHNSFFDIIGKYGIIAGVLLINLFVTALYRGVAYYKKNRDVTHSTFPFAFILMYIFLSLGEALFANIGKGVNVTMFNILGVLALTFKYKEK